MAASPKPIESFNLIHKTERGDHNAAPEKCKHRRRFSKAAECFYLHRHRYRSYEISKLAAQNKDLEIELPVAERCLYYILHDLYNKHRNGQISSVDCRDRKNSAVAQYRQDRTAYDYLLKRIQDNSKLWSKIEHAGTTYAKSDKRTEEADKFFAAVYNAMPVEHKYRRCNEYCHSYLPYTKRCSLKDLGVEYNAPCFLHRLDAQKGSDTDA